VHAKNITWKPGLIDFVKARLGSHVTGLWQTSVKLFFEEVHGFELLVRLPTWTCTGLYFYSLDGKTISLAALVFNEGVGKATGKHRDVLRGEVGLSLSCFK
jgi:hypothetical protein